MEQLSIDEMQISPTVVKCKYNITPGIEQKIDDVIDSIARIDQIVVCHREFVHKIAMICKRHDGKNTVYQVGRHWTAYTYSEQTINFRPEEYITCVRGTIGSLVGGTNCVTSIEITTNLDVYGPLGDHTTKHHAFEFRAAIGCKIIGFHGSFLRDSIVDIGVYMKRGEPLHQQDNIEHVRPQEVEHLRQKLAEEARLRQQAVERLIEAEEDYCKVLNEKKTLQEKIKEYEKFCNSDHMVKFTWFKPSDLPTNFMEQNCLGKGAFGVVYLAEINHTKVAIKVPTKEWQGAREFNQEVDILGRIRHPNVVILIGACPKRNALLYEYLPNGSLRDRLFPSDDKKVPSWNERVKIATDICSALVFLHNIPIAHGDLKPGNILFDSNNTCKLSDFGISRFLKYTNDTETPNHETQAAKGTPMYRDPEFVRTCKLTPQSDVFAFGIILLQLVTGKYKDLYESREEMIEQIGSIEIFQAKNQSEQRKILENFLEASFMDCPTNEAVRMMWLGIQCSDPEGKKRPDLRMVLWNELLNGFGSVGGN